MFKLRIVPKTISRLFSIVVDSMLYYDDDGRKWWKYVISTLGIGI